MNTHSNKGKGKMTYHKTPTASGGGLRRLGSSGISLGSRRFRSAENLNPINVTIAEGNNQPKSVTPIGKINAGLGPISVKARCISIWHSHRKNEAHNPYSLDLVLHDVQQDRIQVWIKKELMHKFEPLFEEGNCYCISNFTIVENAGVYPLLPHRYKLSFGFNTIVTRVEQIDENTNGLVLEPYTDLLSTDRTYSENEAVDVIGSVVGVMDIVKVPTASGMKDRRTVVAEDNEGKQIDFTFWEEWATMWNEYAKDPEKLGHFVVILQLGKVKYYNEAPAVHNALFGTKIIIDQNHPAIVAFKSEIENQEGYEPNQYKIEFFSPEVKVISVADFFKDSVKCMVGRIREIQPNSHCIVLATVHSVHDQMGWAYKACKRCLKRVQVKTTNNRNTSYECKEDGSVQAVSRFRVVLRLSDETGTAAVVFFNNWFVKLSGFTPWELIEKYGKDPEKYFPAELNNVVGKKLLFKLWYSKDNHSKNNYTYRCDGLTEDRELIKHFKKNFIEEHLVDDVVDEPEEEPFEEFTTPSNLIRKERMADGSVNRVLDMHTPPSHDGASGSGESSSTKKRRVFINLDDLDTDSEDENPNKSLNGLVDVKIEPAD